MFLEVHVTTICRVLVVKYLLQQISFSNNHVGQELLCMLETNIKTAQKHVNNGSAVFQLFSVQQTNLLIVKLDELLRNYYKLMHIQYNISNVQKMTIYSTKTAKCLYCQQYSIMAVWLVGHMAQQFLNPTLP